MRPLPVTRLPWHPARLCSSLLRSLAPSQTLQQLAAIPGTQPDSAAACCDPRHPAHPHHTCNSVISVALCTLVFRRRPYRVECTGSLPTSDVKRRRARLVLGWGTAREDLRVLTAFIIFIMFNSLALSLSYSFSLSSSPSLEFTPKLLLNSF